MTAGVGTQNPWARDDESVRVARDRYLAENGFDPDYEARWVEVRMGPVPVRFPNTRGRRAAVRLHDLHHLVTGYPTTWVGEAEIGAWEIAGSCRRYWAAWVLNLAAFAAGLLLAPRTIFRAFVRGRRGGNLYAPNAPRPEAALEGTVGELVRSLGLAERAPRASSSDRLAFLGWSVLAILFVLAVPISAILFWVAMLAPPPATAV